MIATASARSFADNFLGHSPLWYKRAIVACLLVNPVLFALNPYLAGWVLVLQFIFTLAMALRCYPLLPGGLLVLEAVVIGMTTPHAVYEETVGAIEVILLLMFMVAGIFFLKDLLLFTFTKLLINIRLKVLQAFAFCSVAAFLSAFLDALTVTAVVITVASGFYSVYHKVASGKQFQHDDDPTIDDHVHELHHEDLVIFRAFLRSLVMHAVVGTALGGVLTLVGEPQNLLIGTLAGWDFGEFFVRMAPVSLPVLVVGLVTCVLLERLQWFGYGAPLPAPVRAVLEDYDRAETAQRTARDVAVLIAQAAVALFLIIALAFHVAAVGLIGLTVIVLAASLTGVTQEHRIGEAFHDALPFTALLVVFFAVIAVINDQGLFVPIIDWAFSFPRDSQAPLLFVVNGVLSTVSDNVFVATIYINEVAAAFDSGLIDREQFDRLAVVVNTGTNVPSVATPNGQAAFLFLLTSALAPLLRLSYMRMVVMALPYTVTMTVTGLLAVIYLL